MSLMSRSAVTGLASAVIAASVAVVWLQTVSRPVPVIDPVMESYHAEGRKAAEDYRLALRNSPLTQRHCRALSSFGEVMYRSLYLEGKPRSHVRAVTAEALYRAANDEATVTAIGDLLNIAFAERSNGKPVNAARFADEVFDRCLNGLGILPTVDPGPDPVEPSVSTKRPML